MNGTGRDALAADLLPWFEAHGRHDLPWQLDPTPYRTWVSEIMLQQTRVAVVKPYFQRFMGAFPELPDLANATIDDVLALWSGLGYYSRARNLHAAARRCMEIHRGRLPKDFEALLDLPGIGRSTAGAILALAHGRRHPILDGNVKRVLARVHAVEGWPGRSAVARELWRLAEEHTPRDRVREYTQAIMDLGATLCTPRNPDCGPCPLRRRCRTGPAGRALDYPGRKPRKSLPRRQAVLLVALDERGSVLLQRRPPSGIWGGLWSLPQCEGLDPLPELLAAAPDARAEPFEHTFSHFRLEATPWRCRAAADRVRDDDDLGWFGPGETARIGLPKPIRHWLGELFEDRIQWQEKSTA